MTQSSLVGHHLKGRAKAAAISFSIEGGESCGYASVDDLAGEYIRAGGGGRVYNDMAAARSESCS